MKYLFTLITMQFYALFYQYSLPGLQKWSYCFSLYSSPTLLTCRMLKSKFHTFKKHICCLYNKVNSLSFLLSQNQKQVKEILVSRIKCSIITSNSQYVSRSFLSVNHVFLCISSSATFLCPVRRACTSKWQVNSRECSKYQSYISYIIRG